MSFTPTDPTGDGPPVPPAPPFPAPPGGLGAPPPEATGTRGTAVALIAVAAIVVVLFAGIGLFVLSMRGDDLPAATTAVDHDTSPDSPARPTAPATTPTPPPPPTAAATGPGGIPLYSPATVVANTTTQTPSGPVTAVVLRTPDPTAAVSGYYSTELSQRGWTIEAADGTHLVARNSTERITIAPARTGNVTTVTVAVTPAPR